MKHIIIVLFVACGFLAAEVLGQDNFNMAEIRVEEGSFDKFLSFDDNKIALSQRNGYGLYNVTSPTNPRQILSHGGDVDGISIRGNRMFLVGSAYDFELQEAQHWIDRYDITDPATPRYLNSSEFIYTQDLGSEIYFEDDYLYFNYYHRSGRERLNVYDLTDDDTIRQVASLDLASGNVRSMSKSGSTLFISMQQNTDDFVSYIDVTDPLNPRLNGRFDFEGIQIMAHDSLAFVVSDSTTIYSIENGEINERLSVLSTPANRMVRFQGDYLFTSGQRLQIFDISNPRSPHLVGWREVNGNVGETSDLFPFGTTLYWLFDDDWHILNIQDALNVELSTNINVPNSLFLFAFPNPFNSTTTIKYTVTKTTGINLAIYNTRGQLVETLLDKAVPAGPHSVVWEADQKPAGVYLVRISDGRGVMNGLQKVVLVK